MASPIVCVLKGKNGKNGVRITIDYRYVNRFTLPDVTPLSNMSDLIQQIGKSSFISCFDAKSGYHQVPVKPEHRWLTAFICDSGLFQWTRTPFGMRSSGCTFVRVLSQILLPIRDFTHSYVDDMAVHSDSFGQHLLHIENYLSVIKEAGLTLGLAKCSFVKSEIKFVGQVIGSGKRRADSGKVDSIQALKEPETKKQLRQILGFFGFFRDYLPNYAQLAKPLTDLTAKRIPDRIPFGETERKALNVLKMRLCQATMEPLNIIDMAKPFNVFVDSSDYCVGGILTQTDSEGREQPVAFASNKLTPTQQRWATIEKEAYAALWSLQKFKHWIFGSKVTLHSDHNPITFLTDTTPKSSKLMRWALALHEFDIVFKFRA